MKSSKERNTPTHCHSALKFQTCRHSYQWVLPKEFKGSSDFLPFTRHANQPWTSFKFGSEPRPFSSWIWNSHFFIFLYLRQVYMALGGTPLHPMLPAHPQPINNTAAASQPHWQKAARRGIGKQHGEVRVKVWSCCAPGYAIPYRTEQVSFPLHRISCLLDYLLAPQLVISTFRLGRQINFRNELMVFWYQLFINSCQRQNLRLS